MDPGVPKNRHRRERGVVIGAEDIVQEERHANTARTQRQPAAGDEREHAKRLEPRRQLSFGDAAALPTEIHDCGGEEAASCRIEQQFPGRAQLTRLAH